MKKSTTLLALNLSLATIGSASPPGDATVGSALERDDPRIAEALREPIALGPVADAFQEALHLEEVARDLDRAATHYGVIVEKHRARDDDYAAGAAALSLFRMAEIRRKQGREEQARKHYEEIVAEFEDWEPMVSLSRQQLGLDPSDFMPQVTKIEDDRMLTDQIERTLWEVRTRTCDDKFVLVTFEVEPDKEDPWEGMPQGYQIMTLHYLPGGPLTGFISSTSLKGEEVRKGTLPGNPIDGTLLTRVTGFGHSYDVPSGLRHATSGSMAESGWIGLRNEGFDAKVFLTFHDELDELGELTKKLSVSFEFASIPEAKARELAEGCSVILPELGEKAWSFTLPPSPAELEGVERAK